MGSIRKYKRFHYCGGESAGGMVNENGSRQIVLDTENARLWLDPASTDALAEHLLTGSRQEFGLEWNQVPRQAAAAIPILKSSDHIPLRHKDFDD